jgi:hypothetical protein
MSFANRPDKVVCDAFSDPNLELYNPNGVYNRFTNNLTTPILNAKGMLLLNSNFINPILQLNDQSQLMFFYYAATVQTVVTSTASRSVASGTADGTTCTITLSSNTIGVGDKFYLQNTNQIAQNNTVFTAISGTNGSQLVYNTTASSFTGGTLVPFNLRCIRLLPSSYVPPDDYTTGFTRNKYFNTVAELVAQLNLAASTGGDDIAYNPLWVAGQVTFAYDSGTRRVSVAGNGTMYIAPASADDPNVIAALTNTTPITTTIKMKGFNGTSGGTSTPQSYVSGISMNARLGFAMGYATRGLYWTSSSLVGCATSTGFPSKSTSVPVVADANPILIGSQNVNVYTSITTGGGMDSLNRKNLLATIPLEAPALNVNSYTMSSVEKPSLSTPNEIYSIDVEFRDDYGLPVYFPPSYNAELQIAIFY